MSKYWEYTFEDSLEFVDTFDEVPLWSAAFGLLLLKHLELQTNIRMLDLGSGAGFPLIEIAERLGPTAHCFGIDTWSNANKRALKKIEQYGIENIEIIEGSATQLPFDDGSIDLIVSNLGINNFEDRDKVFNECYRVLKSGGKLALTTNLDGHWATFFEVFDDCLIELKLNESLQYLRLQQAHRGNIATISKMITDCGLSVSRYYLDTLDMKFADGSSFLNHHFVKLGWLSSWKNIVPSEEWETVFTLLEKKLNTYSEDHGGLHLHVPMAFVEGVKE